jgi:hypothetical protein
MPSTDGNVPLVISSTGLRRKPAQYGLISAFSLINVFLR